METKSATDFDPRCTRKSGVYQVRRAEQARLTRLIAGLSRQQAIHVLQQVEQHPRQRYFFLLGTEESREIRPEQDVWEHLVLFQQASEEEQEEQA